MSSKPFPWRLRIEHEGRNSLRLERPGRTVRFDPILHWVERGRIRSNLPLAEGIFQACASYEVLNVKVSFAALYGKVLRRKGWEWYDPSMEERRAIAERLLALARSLGITLHACSDPTLAELGVPSARCIDGDLLTRLHPLSLAASTEKDRGQRKDCGYRADQKQRQRRAE